MTMISVVIPAFNAERTLPTTIASVQAQTFQDFEIIVIDDGSTDGTAELLRHLANQDARIRYFSYENGGIARARNRGMTYATGEFIAFLDADDLWTPDKLELQLQALQQFPNAGVAYSWTSHFIDGQEDQIFPGVSPNYSGNVYAQLLLYNILDNGSNPLVRRAAIESVGEFDPTYNPTADWDYYIRLAAKWNFVVVPKHQILYRQSTQSNSANIKRLETACLGTLKKAYQMAPQELQPLKRQSLAWIYRYLARRYLQVGVGIGSLWQATLHMVRVAILHPSTFFDGIMQRKTIKNWLKQQRFNPLSGQ